MRTKAERLASLAAAIEMIEELQEEWGVDDPPEGSTPPADPAPGTEWTEEQAELFLQHLINDTLVDLEDLKEVIEEDEDGTVTDAA